MGGAAMTLDDLAALAREATPGPWVADAGPGGFGTIFVGESIEARGTWLFDREEATVADARYIAACSPEVIAALVSVAQAAEAVQATDHGLSLEPEWHAIDAALATLKEVMSR